MKTKLIGLGILAVVILAAVAYAVFGAGQRVTEIHGYVGGEKVGLLEDEEVADILRDRYGLSIDYAKAGSIDMVTEDTSGQDFLFPSNQTALELYEQTHGSPVRSEIILNTPIVLYTRSAVAEALLNAGLASRTNGIYYVDMAALAGEIESGTSWADIGLPQLYGSVTVATTDPTKSNSGNMFAGLLANTLCGGGRGRKQPRQHPPPAAGYLSEAGVYGELLRRPLRPVFEDRHGGEAADCRVREPAVGVRGGKPRHLGADRRGYRHHVSDPHRLVVPCLHRAGRSRGGGD